MASITIKDLPDNVDLDRKAMRDVHGGARERAQAGAPGLARAREPRIVDFRTGAVGAAQAKRQGK